MLLIVESEFKKQSMIHRFREQKKYERKVNEIYTSFKELKCLDYYEEEEEDNDDDDDDDEDEDCKKEIRILRN